MAIVCAVLALTHDHLGSQCAPHDQPEKLASLQHAFERFRPNIDIGINLGGETRQEFRLSYEFRCMEDFVPEKLQQPSDNAAGPAEPYRQNDLATLRDHIRALEDVKTFWDTQSVKNAWVAPVDRAVFLSALNQFRAGVDDMRQGAEALQAVLLDSPFMPQHNMPSFAAAILGSLSLDLAPASWQDVSAKLQEALEHAEQTSNELLRRIFRELRPLEQAWQSLALFFATASSVLDDSGTAVELYVLNRDGTRLKPSEVASVAAFVRQRNDNIAFQDDISLLVVPGFLNAKLAADFEGLAKQYGLLLLSDLDEERSWIELAPALLPGGRYSFLCETMDPEVHVFAVSQIPLRSPHAFELGRNSEGLFGPSSLVLSSVLGRDNFNGNLEIDLACNSEAIPIRDCGSQLVELLPSRMGRATVALGREASGRLFFRFLEVNSLRSADVLSTFRGRAVLGYVERCIRFFELELSGAHLTRDILEKFETRVEGILSALVTAGAVRLFSVSVDKSFHCRAQGLLSAEIEILIGVGSQRRERISCQKQIGFNMSRVLANKR